MQDSRWSLAADCAAAGRLLPTFFAGPLQSGRTRFAGSAPPSTSNNDSALALGGLGDLAIRYGYQRFRLDIMIITVIILIVLVQIVQSLGNFISAKLNKTKIN